MGTRLFAPAIAACAFASSWFGATATATAQEPVVRPGPHFTVRLYASKLWPAVAGRIADEAQKAAESCWPLLDEWLGVKLTKPLLLHVYAEEAEYRAKEQATNPKIPLESFAQLAAGEAHLLLWPILSAKAVEIVGLAEPTRQALIARAAQLAAAQYAPFAIDDPWLGEVFSYAVLEAIVNPRHEFGLDPAYDTRRYKVAYRLAERQPVLLHPTILDFDPGTTRASFDEDEAAKCLLARMLAMSGKGWAKKLFTKPNKKLTARAEIRSAAVDRALGTDWLKTESLFAKHCQSIRPVWRETRPMASYRDQRLLCVGTQEHSMQFEANEMPPAKGDYRVVGKFELLPCGEDSFRLQLDWTEKSMIGVFIGVGKYSIEKWLPGNEWQKLAEGKLPVFPRKKFEAAVEVGTNVRLLIDGQELATWNPGDRTMRGRWSFGVNDCVVWVENLRLEPVVAGKK